MELALKEVIKNHIQPFLKANGFAKKGNYFYKKRDAFVFAFYVSVDREYTENGAYFGVQFGIYTEELETLLDREIQAFPKGYDFILNESVLTHIFDNDERYLIDNTTNLADFGQQMQNDFKQILVFLDRFSTLEILMDYCLEHNYLVHYEDLMRYLVIKHENEKMENYLIKIKEKLYMISERAHAFYVQKSLKLKAEYTSSTSNDSMASSN
jgi:Domain of unknown function (DUF4304)